MLELVKPKQFEFEILFQLYRGSVFI